MTTLNKKILTELVCAACEGKTLTMTELKTSLLPGQRNMHGKMLATAVAEVYAWCVEKKWPRLPSLVVRASGQDKGIPAPGFWNELDKSNPYGDLWSASKLVDAPIAIKRLVTQIEHQICFNYFGGLQSSPNVVEYSDPNNGPSTNESWYSAGVEQIYKEIPELINCDVSGLEVLVRLAQTWHEDMVDLFIDLMKHTSFFDGLSTRDKLRDVLRYIYANLNSDAAGEMLGVLYSEAFETLTAMVRVIPGFTKLDNPVQLAIISGLANKVNPLGAVRNFVLTVNEYRGLDPIETIARRYGIKV